MMSTIEPTEESGKKTEIIAFSSGKGGTGKTLIATCLGYALTKIGLRVLMIDSDTATDGLSLYLLGPAGLDKVKDFPLGSTLTGVLRQYKEQGNFQFQPWKINRSLKEDHGVIYEAIISGRQLYGDRFETSRDDTSSQQLDRESYRKVIQTLFDSLRAKSEFDYVIVDTRGGFSSESTDVSAIADSYIVVTEADVTSFYQNRNLIQYIDQAASDFGKKAILRSIIVNKSTQFTSTTSDFDLDNLESSFRLQLEREFPIDYKSTHPFPLSFEALTVQKSHKIPLRHALDSDFSYAFLVAFHNILSVVTQPWTKDQVAEWNLLVESVNSAIQKKNEDLQRAEIEEQEKNKELDKLRKDNSEHINRIASMDREIKEIDERYKREIQRIESFSSKLETEKRILQPELEAKSKKDSSLLRRLAPSLIGILIITTIFIFWAITAMPFSNIAPTKAATFTSMPDQPTETPTILVIETAIETLTSIPQNNSTQTLTPTEAQSTVTPLTNVHPACPPFNPKLATVDNLAHFVADITVGKDTQILPSQKFEKTWLIQNVGKQQWDTDYTVAYGVGNKMGFIQPVNFSKTVKTGECIEITIILTAPNLPDTYKGSWILQDKKLTRFYLDDPNVPTLDVVIIVPAQ